MKDIILISNDDSLNAPGIRRLVDCVSHLGEVYVVAPAQQHSGQSAAFTVNSPLKITEHEPYNGARMFTVNGTPVDCVKLSMHNILPARATAMFSGINHGSNSGTSVIYSGTMGAAMEACLQGIPAVGYSILHHSMQADFSECLPYIKDISEKVMAGGLPDGVCLNVNFPAKVKIEGAKVVRAAKSRWTDDYVQYTDPFGKPFYWLTGRLINEEPDDPETDIYWLDRNYATIVPTAVDRNAISAIPAINKLLL